MVSCVGALRTVCLVVLGIFALSFLQQMVRPAVMKRMHTCASESGESPSHRCVCVCVCVCVWDVLVQVWVLCVFRCGSYDHSTTNWWQFSLQTN